MSSAAEGLWYIGRSSEAHVTREALGGAAYGALRES